MVLDGGSPYVGCVLTVLAQKKLIYNKIMLRNGSYFLFPQLVHPPVGGVYRISFIAVYMRNRELVGAVISNGIVGFVGTVCAGVLDFVVGVENCIVIRVHFISVLYIQYTDRKRDNNVRLIERMITRCRI